MTAPTLSPEAAASLAWLREKLGNRIQGPTLENGDWSVQLTRRYVEPSTGLVNERREHHLGRDPEAALRRAREAVEKAIAEAQRGRAA